MSDTDAAGSPLAAAAGAAGEHAIEAFGLLGNETRLAILLALWEAHDPDAGSAAVPFSELRERVGMRDSGQFNYHLGKLEGAFVRRTDDGYRLLPVGLELVQTVVAGIASDAALPRTELELPCHLCGAPTELTFEEGWLYHVCTACEGGLGAYDWCPDGALFAEPFPAAALLGRTPEEVFAAGVARLLQAVTSKVGGLCPRCSGAIETSIHVCENHEATPGEPCAACGTPHEVRVAWSCSICKYFGASAPALAAVAHPEVAAFYHDHGVDVGCKVGGFEEARRVLELLRAHEQRLVSTDPLRVRVTVRHGEDALSVTLDEGLRIVDG
jgi:hypothetical protein